MITGAVSDYDLLVSGQINQFELGMENVLWAKRVGSTTFDRFEDKLGIYNTNSHLDCDGVQWLFTPTSSIDDYGLLTLSQPLSKSNATEAFASVVGTPHGIKYDGAHYVYNNGSESVLYATDTTGGGSGSHYLGSGADIKQYAWNGVNQWCVSYIKGGIVYVSTASTANGVWTESNILTNGQSIGLTTDGTTWALMVYSNVALDYRLYISANGTTWGLDNVIPSATFNGPILHTQYINSKWIFLTSTHVYELASTSGAVTERALPTNRLANHITASGGVYWIAGYDNSGIEDVPWIAHSSDLITWTTAQFDDIATPQESNQALRILPFQNDYN